MVQPSASEMFPAFCRLAMPSAYDRCAASRSPLVQAASPRNPAAPPRVRWSSSGARSSVRRAYVTVPGTSPRARASRAIAIVAGRWRNTSSSTTTIAAAGASGRPRISAVVSSHRSASRSRSSTPSRSPLDSNTWAYATLSTGLQRSTSSGSTLSQSSKVASCRLRSIASTPSSTRSAARAKSAAASAWRIASDADPCCSYHSLARRCSVAT